MAEAAHGDARSHVEIPSPSAIPHLAAASALEDNRLLPVIFYKDLICNREKLGLSSHVWGLPF
jgi:hypothetical protein